MYFNELQKGGGLDIFSLNLTMMHRFFGQKSQFYSKYPSKELKIMLTTCQKLPYPCISHDSSLDCPDNIIAPHASHFLNLQDIRSWIQNKE